MKNIHGIGTAEKMLEAHNKLEVFRELAKNKDLTKLNIFDFYNLSNDKSINRDGREFFTEMFRQKLFKYLKYSFIAIILAFGIVSIIVVLITK